MPRKLIQRLNIQIRSDHAIIASTFLSMLVSDAFEKSSVVGSSIKEIVSQIKLALKEEIGPLSKQREYFNEIRPDIFKHCQKPKLSLTKRRRLRSE